MKRTSLNRILGWTLGGIAGLAIVGFVVWRVSGSATPAPEYQTAVVERGTLLVAVSASGTIQPQERVSLTFEQPGLVAQVPIQVGDAVKEGDVLAQLDTEGLALQVHQAQAGLASAEAQLTQLKAGARPEEVAAAEASVRAVEAQMNSSAAQLDRLLDGASEAEIAAAEAELAAAQAEHKRAKELHDRTMECFTFVWRGFERTICPALGAPEEQARFSLEAAERGLSAAQARYNEALAGSDANQIKAAEANVLAAAAQRKAAQAQLDLLLDGATESQVAAVEAQVDQARAALAEAELALELATLVAPFDGVVAEINVKENEIAPSMLPAVTVLDTSRFHLTVIVDEIDVGRLEEGQAAEVTVEAFPNTVLDGSVASIAPAATFEAGVVYYDIRIDLQPTDVPIRADMTANATVVVDELADVLLIPTWVVRVDNTTGQTYVDRLEGKDTVRVDVTLGVRYEGVAEVVAGLDLGDELVWVPSRRFGPQ
jgi:HlyD family secretion protein